MAGYIFTADLVDELRRNPIHEVLRELGRAGRDFNLLNTRKFRKLLGYLTEFADGRDRREPMVDVPGTHRPQPRLRVLINEAFGQYGDLTWFKLNKTTNASRLPLRGVFPRMAASVGRINLDDLDDLVRALVSDAPDKLLLRLLNERGGRVRNTGLELFTRIAHLFQPDLYFLAPRPWGDESGCLKFINDDLRKYCALCRTLREICDEVGFPPEIRAVLFDRAVQMRPIHPKLEGAINASIGGALAWANVLDANEGYTPGSGDEEISMPLEVAAPAIRVRRGESRLRTQLCRFYENKCAISGDCPKDLLEVAYIAPYPAGDVNSLRNAILLRSDLHTLWDLNLIAVHPESQEVVISDALRGTYYETFAGRTLTPRSDAARVDATAIRERWAQFEARHKKPERPKKSTAKPALAAEVKPTDAKPAPAPDRSAEPEIAVLDDLEPKRSSGSGIWRSPKQAAAANPAANAPVIEIADEEAPSDVHV